MKALRLAMVLIWLATSAAWAERVSPRVMVLDGKVIEATDCRQVTFGENGDVCEARISPDGRTIAYAAVFGDPADANTFRSGLYTVPVSGGKPTVLLDDSAARAVKASGAMHREIWMPTGNFLMWSRDSRYIAADAAYTVSSEQGSDSGDGILVWTRAGTVKATLKLPPTLSFLPPLRPRSSVYWNASGMKFAMPLHRMPKAGEKKSRTEIVVFDVNGGEPKTVYSVEETGLSIIGWSADGSSVLFTERNDSANPQLKEVSPRTGKDRVVNPKYSEPRLSPDGRFVRSEEKPWISLHNVQTGKEIEVDKNATSGLSWSPNGSLFAYTKLQEITGEPNRDPLGMLWIGTPRSSKLNHMCLTADLSNGTSVGWSADSSKLMFVSGRRVHVATLGTRPPMWHEKIAEGIPLTEQETATVLADNLRQIGNGFRMYCFDHDEQYPTGSLAEVMKEITPYLKNDQLFNRPGTGECVFNYNLPGVKESDIQDTSNTVLGTMDAGYNWEILLYVDGHVKQRQKGQ